MIRKLLALVLSMMMIVSAVPVQVLAAPSAFSGMVSASEEPVYVPEESEENSADLAEEEDVELPEVEITDITDSLLEGDPDLTFALNFAIKDMESLTEEYLEKLFDKYGDWYVDYVLTISGLTDAGVTFNANGGEGVDGYLAGQYDAWSASWVTVPFEDVTVANGESLYIMEYAAKLMGKNGLRFTLAEIAEIVQNFDCGVYFTPEFLAANPDMKVELELKVFTENEAGEKINDISVAKNEFEAPAPKLPTATVTELENDALTFALNFKADDAADAQLAYYGDWYADFVLTVNKDVTFNANGGADGYLSGQYDAWSENWVNVPFENVTLKAGESLKIMEYAAELMGKSGLKLTYNDVYSLVKDFNCGVFLEPEFLEKNDGLEITLELKMFNPADENESYVIGETYEFEAVTLPEVVITDIKNTLTDSDPDLTFALNFAIKDAENLDEEYLEKLFNQYGDWYVDYVLTISDLTAAGVTFNANGGADGYLAGQYDAWSASWVSVPFDDVTVQNNQSLYIMEYAAKLMNKQGLRFTLAEVAEIVQNFDCGVYFTPEFLAANPDMKVDLELKVFTEDAEGNKINDISVAKNEFKASDVVTYVAQIGEETYASLTEAFNAANDDDTVTVLADVVLTESLINNKKITLDLAGKTISQSKACTAHYAMIVNKGNLTITGNGKISFTDTGAGDPTFGWGSYTIENRGNLVVENGTIENKSTLNKDGVKHMYSALQQAAGSTTINGGTITTSYYRSVRINKGNLTINGGTFNGQVWVQPNQGDVNITVAGGTFAPAGADGSSIFLTNAGETYAVNASITGGTFTTKIGATEPVAVISGGKFTEAAKNGTNEALIAKGYEFGEAVDGYYGVEPNMIFEFHLTDANGDAHWLSPLRSNDINAVLQTAKVWYNSLQGTYNFTLELQDDCELDETIVVDFPMTLDLNGHTITGTDNATGSFSLFSNKSNLTVKDSEGTGKITLTANNNRGWNAYSSVISNNQGTVVVEGGTIKHLGGTNMAYAIDNLTNGNIGDATLTVNGGVMESTYRAIRQFANSTTKTNTLTINAGTVKSTGGNKAVWLQGANESANKAALLVEGGNIGVVYVEPVNATAVTAKVAASVEGVVAEIPAGYVMKNEGGYYVLRIAKYVAQVGTTKYESLADAIAAAQAGDTVTFLADITENVTVNKSVTIDGADKNYTGTITISGNVDVTVQNAKFEKGYIKHTGNTHGNLTVKGCSFANGGYAVETASIDSVTIENCTVTNQSLLYARRATPNITVKNVTVTGGNYVAHIAYGDKAYFENVKAIDMTRLIEPQPDIELWL